MGRCTECSCRTNVTRPRSQRISPRLEKRSIGTERAIFSCPRASCCGHSQPATLAMVTFDDYTIDLSQFMHAVSTMKRPRERTTAQLMAPDAKDRADPALFGHIRSELLDRLASPLYAFAGGLIAFAALGRGADDPPGARRCDRRSGSRVCRRAYARDRSHDPRRWRAVRRHLRMGDSASPLALAPWR